MNYINMLGAYKVNNELWFASMEYNAICHYNINSNKLKIENIFPNEETHDTNLYGKIINYENKLFFLPCDAKEIAVMDMGNNIIEKIPLRDGDVRRKFFDFVVLGQYAYLFPFWYSTIIKVNLETYEVEYMDIWMEKIRDYIKENTTALFLEAIIINNKIILPFLQDNIVFVLDTEDVSNIDVYKFGQKGDSFSFVKENNGRIYICCSKLSYVLCLDTEMNVIKKYKLIDKDSEHVISSMWIYNEKIYLLTYIDNYIYEISLKSDSVNRRVFNTQEYSTNIYDWTYCGSIVDNNSVILLPYNANRLLIINLETFEIDKRTLLFSNAIVDNGLRNKYIDEKDKIIYENDLYNLEQYLLDNK